MPADTLRHFGARSPGKRGWINPRYARWCRENGLRTPSDFLDLPGEVVSGHRDRHVLEVRVGRNKLFLKKEHRTPIWTRVRNWCAGYGLVSLSEREALTLERLRQAGVPAPQWLAAGRDKQGRAFLLLRRVRGVDLRTALGNRSSQFCHWRVARSLGSAIGRLHRAGFDAPDLSAKHVLVKRNGGVVLLDWARARKHDTLDQSQCLSSLAALHGSLNQELANSRLRLAVLKSWMKTLGFRGPAAPFARKILSMSDAQKHRRSIREQLYAGHDPRLLWIEGEALCVCRSYWRSTFGQIPETVQRAALEPVPWRTEETVEPTARLISFPSASRWQRFCSFILRRPLQSIGIQQAGMAFRLRRHGVPIAQVLAFGGRRDGGGFLLCRVTESMRPARSWLALPRLGRRSILNRIGQLLRRCHESGCGGIVADSLMVETTGRPRLRLIADGRLRKSSTPSRRTIIADLQSLTASLGLVSRSDVTRIVRGYYRCRDIDANALRVTAETLHLTGRRAA